MSTNLPEEIAALKPAFGVTEKGPVVSFFDHAEPDGEATKQSGRPRFRDVTYVRFQTRDDITRSVFCCKAEDEHKENNPKEWAHYCERKKGIDNRAPVLWALPGMSRAKFEELRALGLNDCEQLADYEGALDQLTPFKTLAIKIMEISDESVKRVQERRREDRASYTERSSDDHTPGYGRGTRTTDVQAAGEGGGREALRAGREDIPASPDGRAHHRGEVSGRGTISLAGLDRLRGLGALSSENSGREPVQKSSPRGQDRLLRSRQVDDNSFDMEIIL